MRFVQLFLGGQPWDTHANNGVLIYVLRADRAVEIIADRGVSARVSEAEWQGLCREVEQQYREQRYAQGSVAAVAGKKIRTIEGLGTPEKPHPVQAAFLAEQVPLCGYCINGWMMTATALLEKSPHRSDADIRHGLAGLKCRCGSHMAILRAVKRAAKSMA